MKRKLKGGATAAIVLFVTSGMLASLLGLRQFDRLNSAPTWVVNADITSGEVIRPAHLSQQPRDKDFSSGSLQNPRELIGKQLVVNKKSGDTLKSHELTTPVRKTLSQSVPEGRVLFTLRQPQGGIPYSQLHRGDRLDVVVRGRSGVRTVARDIQLMGVLRSASAAQPTKGKGVMNLLKPGSTASGAGSGKVSLVMAVRPGDVYPLVSIGERESVALVLHSAHDVAKGLTQIVGPIKTHRVVEVVSGLQRHSISIKR